MTLRSCLHACLSIAAVAAPLGIASSSAPGFAQMPEPVEQMPAPQSILPADAPLAPEPAIAPGPAPEPAIVAAPSIDPRQVECVAKIILHEAANEPRAGRVAVAQVVRTRMKDRRFAPNACAVARQRGQFFDVDAFNPSRDGRWHDAVAIATDTLSGSGDEMAPGALFFHAVYSPMPGHTRVTQIGGHVFYR